MGRVPTTALLLMAFGVVMAGALAWRGRGPAPRVSLDCRFGARSGELLVIGTTDTVQGMTVRSFLTPWRASPLAHS